MNDYQSIFSIFHAELARERGVENPARMEARSSAGVSPSSDCGCSSKDSSVGASVSELGRMPSSTGHDIDGTNRMSLADLWQLDARREPVSQVPVRDMP